MELSSQRKVRYLEPTWDLEDISVTLTSALTGTGPALALSPVDYDSVDSSCALIVSTTGTSGVRKDVSLSATALLSNARASLTYLNAEPGQRWSLLLPLTHVAGINVLIRSLELGTAPVDLRYASDYVDVDYTAIVPTQLHSALHGDEKLLHHLQAAKAVLVGGAALESGVARMAQAAGITVITTYGATETSGGCVYNGRPLAGTTVEIENGLIVIKGKTLASGYLNHPELWTDHSRFETQDLGDYRDGHLTILGRADDVIITGGANVSLHQVEELLRTQFPSSQAVAVGIPDDHWGQALHVAHVGELDAALATKVLSENIGESAKPKGFHRVSELPLIGIGKIDRRALAKMLQ